jgi:penicillin amidase
MKKFYKVLFGVLAAVIILIVAVTLFAYFNLRASLPDYEGEVKVNGIKESVTIYRDSVGIAYIKASNEEDAAFGLGYAQAQERLFQMDIFRRVAEGRLSEIMGEKTLQFDKLFRTLGFKKEHEKYYNALSPRAKKIMNAYARGVNAFINSHKGDLPPEFTLLDYEPEAWRPYQSVLISKLLAYQLNISWWTDITFSKIAQKLGREKAKLFLPNFPENAPTIIPEHLYSSVEISDELVEIDRELREFLGFTGTHIGSNNWTVNAAHSKSGKPIIANDPHLAHQIPGQWYLAVINSPEWKVAGVTIPGVPGVVIGNNGKISWVLTNVMADDSDYYLEKIDSSGNKYLLDGEWRQLEVYDDTLAVKDKGNVVIRIRKTHRGPIISDVYQYGTKDVISMRWTALDATRELDAFLQINNATNWEEFKNGVRNFSAPGQNFVYADAEGNIGYICGVKLPIRRTNNTTFVFDGTTSKSDWLGFVPFEELPMMFNPARGFIATANNKTIRNYKYHISNLWEPPSRIERITELLRSKEKHSVSDFQKYQLDFVSPYAREITPFILNAFKGKNIENANLATAVDLLRNWDFSMPAISQTPAIYSVFFMKLVRNAFADELGDELFDEYIFIANVPYRKILEIIYDNNHPIWDDVNTEKIETRDDIIRKSLAQATEELETRFGKEPALWQWGKLHYILFKHPFHGVSSLLDKIFDVGPFPIGGGGTTIFNTEYKFTKPFANILGPSMRYIYDFAKPNEFYIVLPNGQSGHFMSEHYKDMTLSWLHGNYFKVNMESVFNDNSKAQKLILEP